MAKTKAATAGFGWFTKKLLAEAFGINERTFDKVYRRFASPDATKEIDGKLFFRARDVIEAWSAAQNKPTAAPSDDPLLASGDSPALEEYRKARARLAWMDVNQREKTHVPLAELEPSLMGLTSVLRQAGDRLARQHGNDAAAILNEAIDQWAESLEDMLKNDESDAPPAEEGRAEHPHPRATDHARVR